MRLEQLETPALVLDLDAYEENRKVMNDLAKQARIALRPHYKSHKSTAIAQMQIQDGAKGITCSKIGEAEDLVFAGIEDVLIGNQIVEPVKLARVAYLASCCHLTICVDTEEQVKALEAAAAIQGSTVYCLIEYEVGMKRCGVDTPEAFFALAQQIDRSPHLVFEGIQAYAGQLSHEEDFETRQAESERVKATLFTLRDYVQQRGLSVKEISGISTGTVEFHTSGSPYTEIQAGSYIFMDMAYGALNLSFQNALFVMSTVMSTNCTTIIVDTGRKSISVDQKMPVFKNFPEAPVGVSEEHSSITIEGHKARLGDRYLMIPGHCCTTVNLHDHLYLVRQGKVIDRIPITSRGKSF